MAGIGKKMEENPQMQQLAEIMLSYAFNSLVNEPGFMEEMCEDFGMSEEEIYWMLEQLGYDREDYMEEE